MWSIFGDRFPPRSHQEKGSEFSEGNPGHNNGERNIQVKDLFHKLSRCGGPT